MLVELWQGIRSTNLLIINPDTNQVTTKKKNDSLLFDMLCISIEDEGAEKSASPPPYEIVITTAKPTRLQLILVSQ